MARSKKTPAVSVVDTEPEVMADAVGEKRREVRFDEITIDNDFAQLLGNYDDEKLDRLRAKIHKYGLLHRLVVWIVDGKMILIDGHQHHRCLTKYKDEFQSLLSSTITVMVIEF